VCENRHEINFGFKTKCQHHFQKMNYHTLSKDIQKSYPVLYIQPCGVEDERGWAEQNE
jgi:hypothetical protein